MTVATTVGNIQSVGQMVEALEELAYPIQKQEDDCVITCITVGDRKFPVALSMNEAELIFDCRVASVGDICGDVDDEKKVAQAFVLLSSLNQIIRPFATATLDTEDGLDATDPVVLTDSIAVGDLSLRELELNMSALRNGLQQIIAAFSL